MTGDERLANVAEVLAATIEPESYRRTPPPDRVNAYVTTLAQALESLLDGFRADDEARGARRVAEAVEAVAENYDHANAWGIGEQLATDLRAALGAAEPDAGER